MKKAILLGLALGICSQAIGQNIDLSTYVLPNQRFVTAGYVVECSPPGLKCVWTGAPVDSRTYPTGTGTYTLLKSFGGEPFEDYSILASSINLNLEWGGPGNNTFYPGGVQWLPRYLNLFGQTSWDDNIRACTNSSICTSCNSNSYSQVTGVTTTYFVLRLWNQIITPNGPEYILTRHNRWPPATQATHEIYYYGLNQGWLGWDEYVVSGSSCANGEYWPGDPYFPADEYLCLNKRTYVTSLPPDNGATKNCN